MHHFIFFSVIYFSIIHIFTIHVILVFSPFAKKVNFYYFKICKDMIIILKMYFIIELFWAYNVSTLIPPPMSSEILLPVVALGRYGKFISYY